VDASRREGPVLLDLAAPPFLAAQANVGRWVLPRQQHGSRQRPRQPPPTEVQVHAAVVISGVYDQPGWNRLVEAEGEADDLLEHYGATKVEASYPKVLSCLGGDPAAELLHFAVHGIYDPTSIQNGLMLTDGETLNPLLVAGSDLGQAPFVFLNACQVGQGNQILGDYSGLAAEFLTAGASGVVAPLWSIKDTVAREIARDFYAKTAGGAAGPAAALREARKAFKPGLAAQSATYLAYQFFGHPGLKLRFSKA
jgi:CHAT domain-containing protein